MNNAPPPKLFDPARVARNRDRASFRYQNYAFLKQRESSHLLERLADVSRQFGSALDLGGHDGTSAQALRRSGQVADILVQEPSEAMAHQAREQGFQTVVGPLAHLPYAPGRFDLVTSVLSLHWANDLPGTLVQIREVLKPDGLFLGCLFGGATLQELRTSLIEAESALLGGITPRLSPMPGLQDMAGLLQRAGFALPVADVDRVTVRYSSPLKLLEDLKGMGEQAAFAQREREPRQPLSRRLLAAMDAAYRDRFSDPDGKVRATFDIVWLSGWTPAPSQPKPLRPGSGKVSMADAVRKMRASGPPGEGSGGAS
ncbi:MAG: methyltransferase domain-containing protein [Pseudomonadota bacterium]